jgi:hypothetical protein
VDRLASTAARRVVEWCERYAEPARRPWLEALRAELGTIESGPAQLRWALGSLALVRIPPRRNDVLKSSLFGLVLGVILMVVIVWSNVIVPSHESDDEYGAWYLAFYLGLFVYFGIAGSLASGRRRPTFGRSALTGAATALLSVGIALLTFIVIDNLFLDIVMTQPDKMAGFANSGLSDARDYVNQGNLLAVVIALPVTMLIGAAFGALGGAIRTHIAPS